MVSISLSIQEAEYLRSLVLADIETRESGYDWQKIAIAVYDHIVIGHQTVVVDMSINREIVGETI